jgi:guanylate kinase
MSNILNEDLKGVLILISGPSGVGKGTVIKELKKLFPNFIYPVSSTTRKMRPGEKDREVYYFISRDEFEKGILEGRFLEWACVHGENYYGMLKAPVIKALKEGKVVLREVDVQGVMSITDIMPAENLVTIFIKAASPEELLARISQRGKLPDDEIARRMESAKKELKLADNFKYQVFNRTGGVEECVDEVFDIIKKETENLKNG